MSPPPSVIPDPLGEPTVPLVPEPAPSTAPFWYHLLTQGSRMFEVLALKTATWLTVDAASRPGLVLWGEGAL